MKTFAIFNRKGGVGKTTTAINLAYIFAVRYRLRVLLIDADSQGNASSILPSHEADGLSDVLRGVAPYWEDLIVHSPDDGLDVLPAGDDLMELDLDCMLGNERPNYERLKEFVEVLAEDDVYDVVIIDCPPVLHSVSCVNALTASTRVIIPTDTDYYSVSGMEDLMAQIDSIRKAAPYVSIAGALVTQWQRNNVVTGAVDFLQQNRPVPLYDTVIRRSFKVRESTWVGQPVAKYAPKCITSRDYFAWAAELLSKEGLPHEK